MTTALVFAPAGLRSSRCFSSETLGGGGTDAIRKSLPRRGAGPDEMGVAGGAVEAGAVRGGGTEAFVDTGSSDGGGFRGTRGIGLYSYALGPASAASSAAGAAASGSTPGTSLARIGTASGGG